MNVILIGKVKDVPFTRFKGHFYLHHYTSKTLNIYAHLFYTYFFIIKKRMSIQFDAQTQHFNHCKCVKMWGCSNVFKCMFRSLFSLVSIA